MIWYQDDFFKYDIFSSMILFPEKTNLQNDKGIRVIFLPNLILFPEKKQP